MKLIVGLGNPGKRYEKTRHNVGFMVLDALHKELERYDISSWELSKKFNAQISGCNIQGEKVLLVKPMTFMNHSGQSVGLIAHYYKILPEDVIVVHDEKDIGLGEIKVQDNRGHAGHNGIRSIIEHLGTKDFTRYRIGIAAKQERRMRDTGKFVLSKFGLFERGNVDAVIQETTTQLLKKINK